MRPWGAVGKGAPLLVAAALAAALGACAADDGWRTASREPAGLAPDPATTPEAVLLVFGAPAWGWRGWFAIHTWIAAKRSGEPAYSVYEVVGWRLRQGRSAVRVERDAPDRYWYGERPALLKAHRGKGVDEMIAAVERAVEAYPWPDRYRAWPGPNSNTFTAWIAQQVPELRLTLPMAAIGKGWLD